MAIGTVGALLGAAAIGGIASNSAAKKSAAAVSDATDQSVALQQAALDQQRDIYLDARELNMPAIEARDNALAALQNGTQGPQTTQAFQFNANDLYADPGYQFRQQQAQDALSARLAATGQSLGGDALRAFQELGDGMAAQEYGAAYNRAYAADADFYNRQAAEYGTELSKLNALAGIGQAGASGVQSAGGQFGNALGSYAANTGNALMNGAQAQAGAYQGGANALTGFLGDAATTMGGIYGMNGGAMGGAINPFGSPNFGGWLS